MKNFPLVAFMLMLAALTVGCRSKPSSRSALPLPGSDQAAGWAQIRAPRTFEAANLWQYLDGDAERYVRAGVQRSYTADYRYQGQLDATVDVYEFSGVAGAKHILETESALGSQTTNFGDEGRLYTSSVVFRRGKCLARLVALGDSPQTGQAMPELARAVEANFGVSRCGP